MYKLLAILMALAMTAQVASADIWEDLAKYKMGGAVETPVEVQALIVKTPLAERGAIEDALIKVIESKTSTPEAKWFSCRMLQRVGTEKCVPTLAALLTDEELSHYARLALQRMEGSRAAGMALVGALDKASDKLKPGILGSIAERGSRRAVGQVAKLTASKDPSVVAAALQALGKIGGKEAQEAILTSEVPDSLQAAKMDALILWAEQAKDAGTFMQVFNEAKSDTLRGAALRGLVATDDTKGTPIVVALLKGDEDHMREVAQTLITVSPSVKLTQAVCAAMLDMDTGRQAHIASLLGERGDKTALRTVMSLMRSTDQNLREAAIAAVGLLGNAACVKPLLAQAQDDVYGQKVMDAIVSMTDEGVNDALVASLNENSVKASAIQAVVRRNVTAALPTVKTLVGDADADVRKAAWDGLGKMASQNDLDGMMKMMQATKADDEKRSAQAAIKAVCSRATDKNACADIVAAYYEKSDESAKMLILDAMAAAGGSKSLDLVRTALKSGNKALYEKAVRTLSSWPTDAAAGDLLELAKNAPEEKTRILSLQGLIQVAAKSGNANKTLANLKEASLLVKRVDEKRLLIGALRDTKHPDVLALLADYVADAEVKAEAQQAIVDSGDNVLKDYPEDVTAAVTKVLQDTNANKNVLKKAKGLLDKTKTQKNKKKR